MNNKEISALALEPSLMLERRGLEPDPWQREVLHSRERFLLLNCCRQAGKSTVTSALALHQALFTPDALVVLVSPAQRQSAELFRKVMLSYDALGRPIKARYETLLSIEFVNRSRILCLPAKDETIRGYSPQLLVIDEAARVDTELYKAVRPMLVVSKGRLIALSTPAGQHGWFYEEWHGQGPWQRFQVAWRQCPRISAAEIVENLRALGQAWVNQEYECLFTAREGVVYPDFALAHTSECRAAECGRAIGGIDWGWHNPFAAVWGVLDKNDILWIQNERYASDTPLHEHAQALPRGVMWYADPAGPTEMAEFAAAGHSIRKADNEIALGIAAVTGRLRTGRLKVNVARCPMLSAESKLYRYPYEHERKEAGENPVNAHNHALAPSAISSAASTVVTWPAYAATLRRGDDAEMDMAVPIEVPTQPDQAKPASNKPPYLGIDNEDLWTPLT